MQTINLTDIFSTSFFSNYAFNQLVIILARFVKFTQV